MSDVKTIICLSTGQRLLIHSPFCGHARHKPIGGQRVGEIMGFML